MTKKHAKPEHLELSERDSLRVLELLENPPKPNAKMRAAIKAHREIFGRKPRQSATPIVV